MPVVELIFDYIQLCILPIYISGYGYVLSGKLSAELMHQFYKLPIIESITRMTSDGKSFDVNFDIRNTISSRVLHTVLIIKCFLPS